MILTISDSEEGILNKIKSVLACESTLEVMEITNSEKLTFQGLEIDQLQRSVIKDGKVVELTRHEYDLLFYLALSPNRVFTKEQIYQHIYEDVESEVDNRVYGLVKNLRKKSVSRGLPRMEQYFTTTKPISVQWKTTKTVPRSSRQ